MASFDAGRKAASEAVVNTANAALHGAGNAAGKVIGVPAHGAGLVVGAVEGAVSPITKAARKGMKGGVIMTLIAAALGGLWMYSSSSRKKNRYDPAKDVPDALKDEAPSVLTAQELIAQQQQMSQLAQANTMMGMNPIEGDMAKKVKLARAGQIPGMPNLSAPSVDVDGKPVEDLGATPAR